MTERLELWLTVPEDHAAPSPSSALPEVVLEGTLRPETQRGDNTLLLAPGDFLVARVWARDGAVSDGPGFSFSTDVLTDGGVRGWGVLSERLGRSVLPGQLHPFIAVRRTDGEAIVHHLMDTGPRGSLYVRYGSGSRDADAATLLEACAPVLRVARNSFNDGCWYSKYRADVEIETKFTFPRPVDTWRLNYRLYRQIVDGKLVGFIPEFNDEFQVWDFENHMFEVRSPAEQRGYITFIPQSNGRMTVKQKLFAADQEVRVERLTANVELTLEEIDEHARALCGGEVRRLPAYRRKRFDVNLESLATGNVYGIFFDLCRPLGDEENALFQCEVEYLRSRTMRPLERVLDEYREVVAFTEEFLHGEGLQFERGFFSKLSYLKQYAG